MISPAMPDELPPHADPARFDALVESVAPDEIVAVIARSMGAAMRGRHEPEDLWQETLAAAWRDRAQHRWESPQTWRTWLITIARNRIRDLSRHDGAEKRGGGGAALFSERRPAESLSLSDILPAGSVTPSRTAIHNERARRILEALASLPDDVEPVVRLHLLEDRTMESVADELGIHLAAAWRRFRRGAELYRESLRRLGFGPADSSVPPGGAV